MPANSSYASSVVPGVSLFVITPHNSTDFTYIARQIYVGVGGDVVVVDNVSGTAITFKNVTAGSVLGPFAASRVNATNTTATDMVGFV